MRKVALLGNPDTKRTDYFRQAAKKASLPICFVDWNDWGKQWGGSPETELFLKIDPPLWKSCSLGELDSLHLEGLGAHLPWLYGGRLLDGKGVFGAIIFSLRLALYGLGCMG